MVEDKVGSENGEEALAVIQKREERGVAQGGSRRGGAKESNSVSTLRIESMGFAGRCGK